MTREDLIHKVRIFIRDHDGLRTLLENNESTDEEINLSIDMGISFLNSIPPITDKWDENNYPLSLVIYATLGELLTSIGIASTANELPYQDGNVGSIDTEAKAGPYLQLAQTFTGYVMQRAATYKASRDIETTLAPGIDSDGNSNVGIPSGQF